MVTPFSKFQKIEEIEGEGLYNSLYAIMSDSIHSDWGETRQLYLKKQEEKICIIQMTMKCPMADYLFQLIGDYYMYTYMNDSEKYLYN